MRLLAAAAAGAALARIWILTVCIKALGIYLRRKKVPPPTKEDLRSCIREAVYRPARNAKKPR